MTVENIRVIGAGIADLNAALALSKPGRRVTLIERDPPPPEGSADEAFDVWERRGVGHLRHSHAFLARLYLLLREKYPDLLQVLLDAGCRELRFRDGVPDTLRQTYEPTQDDNDCFSITLAVPEVEMELRRLIMGNNLIRTNPLHGRGCSFAAVEAQELDRALEAGDDPVECARSKKRNKAYYPPRIGPKRDEMFKLLELSPTLDWEKYNKAA